MNMRVLNYHPQFWLELSFARIRPDNSPGMVAPYGLGFIIDDNLLRLLLLCSE